MACVVYRFDGQQFARVASELPLVDALDSVAIGAADEPILKAREWQWVCASTIEDADVFNGAEPTAFLLDSAQVFDLARNYASSPRKLPVDGGGFGSAPHGTVSDSSTPANGWIHRVAVAEQDGAPALYVHAELMPQVAEARTAGRLAYASIVFSPRDGSPVLRSCALTNAPFNRRIIASTQVEARQVVPTKETQNMAENKVEARAEDAPPVEDPKASAEGDAVDMAAALEELQSKIAEQDAKIAELSAMVEALGAERDALAADVAATAEARTAQTAEEQVEAAIKDGKILPVARTAYVIAAKAQGPEAFARTVAGLRKVVPTLTKITPATDATAEAVVVARAAFDSAENDALNDRLRALGHPSITRALEKRAKNSL